MPRKKFEDVPYNPIAADLAREVAIGARSQTPSAVIPLRVEETSQQGNTALQPQRPQPITRQSVAPVAKREEPTITKRFVVTRDEDAELTEFLVRLQRKAGTKVSLSVVTRALLNIAMQAEEQISTEIGVSQSSSLHA